MAILLDKLGLKLCQELLTAPNTWIAELLGHDPQVIQQWRKRHGLPAVTGRGGKPRPGKVEWLKRWRTTLYRETA